ncbi:NfeD family protein [Fulvivirgaceae bacterium BMA10]|uniref:NfeD family protein n=1 Tax=Splendidivirga corallicola TaxID=3051826 RepID=A0ABT8L1H7_9BACT|nr:NfeD family protein [Fulvivirgaceae bacterium BMA10]
MIDWIIILALIIFGLGLILAEVIFIPGTTIVGILGLLFSGTGVYISFTKFGSTTGFIVLSVTALATIIMFIISIRKGVWKKFALKTSIESRVNEDIELGLKEGDAGVALSSLRPIGKAEFGDQVLEVKTFGNYVEAGSKIRVIKVEKNKVIVEPLN